MEPMSDRLAKKLSEVKDWAPVLLDIEKDTQLTEEFAQMFVRYDPESERRYTDFYLDAVDKAVNDLKVWVRAYHAVPGHCQTRIEKEVWDEIQRLIIILKAMQVAVVG